MYNASNIPLFSTKFKITLILVLAFSLFCFWMSGYTAGSHWGSTHTVNYRMPSGLIGYTYCDNETDEPVSVLSADIFEDSDTLLARETIAHETMHRAQLLPACKASMRALKATPRGLLLHEAQAYCFGLLTVTREGSASYVARRPSVIARLQLETVSDGWMDSAADAALAKAGCPR